MLLSPRHSKKVNLDAAIWAGHGGFLPWGEQEQEPPQARRAQQPHTRLPPPAQPHSSQQRVPPSTREHSTLPASLERAPPFHGETPTGMQTVQAHLIQISLRR